MFDTSQKCTYRKGIRSAVIGYALPQDVFVVSEITDSVEAISRPIRYRPFHIGRRRTKDMRDSLPDHSGNHISISCIQVVVGESL